MRRSFLVCLACSTFAVPALADDIKVQSDIVEATVYTDRAALTRRAEVKIPAGSHTLIFEGLPANFYQDSLRADGRSRAKVTFGAVSHKRVSSADYIAPREKALNAQLVKLQDVRKSYQADKKALAVSKTFLESLGKNAALRENEKIAQVDLNPETWGAVSDNLTTKMAANLKRDLATDIQIRETSLQIQKVQAELNQLRTGQKQTHIVSLPFESDSATTLTVDLSYQIGGAGWRPLYDARLDVKNADLDLIQYGSVWQRTGEDWEDVKLTLSTAQPSRGAGLPKLNPQWVSIFEPRPQKRLQKSGQVMNMMADFAEVDSVSAAPAEDSLQRWRMLQEERVESKRAVVNTEGFVAEYAITGPATVKADGTQSKHLIGSFETENSLEVQVKPQYGLDAYLVAKTTLKGDASILPGQVSLFRDGAYIGKSNLPMLRPNDVQGLAFGIDDNVSVTRNILKDERSEAGIITKDAVIERHFTTEVKNLHKTAVKIALLETIPVSKDERVNVTIVNDKTTGGYAQDIEDRKGVMRWPLELEPQESAKVDLGWKVSWPKGKSLSGVK